MNTKVLPTIPMKKNDETDPDDFEFYHEFARQNVKIVIHLITDELKVSGVNIEYLMIPFRREQTNEKLLKFLNKLFPLGNGKKISETRTIKKIVSNTDCFTLFQALKYIWCRLPNGEIIGWNSYLEFKAREKYAKYPKKAFLEIMPKCLSSSNHASIVYDFLDLIVTISSNSKVNKLSARKISKMSALWAFNNKHFPENVEDDIFDIPSFNNDSIQHGLAQWIPASNAMFHILLAFLKSFLPSSTSGNNEANSKLPRNLKHFLLDNEYPPIGESAKEYTSQSILTIPLVTLNTNQFSRKNWQLLERCNDLLDFDDQNAFPAREDYALLKSLFNKKNNIEGISRKMSQESRRIMKLIQTKHSTFQAGWSKRTCIPDSSSSLKEEIDITRIDIDDYFIWTWLSSLSYEQTGEKKGLFGRSLILEFEFDGFKKWVVFQECDINLLENADSIKDIEEQDITTAMYDKLQNNSVTPELEKPNVTEVSNTSIDYGNGLYHTIISKEALHCGSNNKHNLHSLEQKISKWNPLHNLRNKTSSSSASNQNQNTSSSSIENNVHHNSPNVQKNVQTMHPGSSISAQQSIDKLRKDINPYVKNETPNDSTSHNIVEPMYNPQKQDSNIKREDRIVSQYSLFDPSKYQLPAIEKGDEGFKIDLPDIDDFEEEPAILYNQEITKAENYTFQIDNNTNEEPVQGINNSTYIQEYSPLSNSGIAYENIPPSRNPDRHSNTMGELNGMVEQMIEIEKARVADLEPRVFGYSVKTENETFESLTKFNQYKPSQIVNTDQSSGNNSKSSLDSRPSPYQMDHTSIPQRGSQSLVRPSPSPVKIEVPSTKSPMRTQHQVSPARSNISDSPIRDQRRQSPVRNTIQPIPTGLRNPKMQGPGNPYSQHTSSPNQYQQVTLQNSSPGGLNQYSSPSNSGIISIGVPPVHTSLNKMSNLNDGVNRQIRDNRNGECNEQHQGYTSQQYQPHQQNQYNSPSPKALGPVTDIGSKFPNSSSHPEKKGSSPPDQQLPVPQLQSHSPSQQHQHQQYMLPSQTYTKPSQLSPMTSVVSMASQPENYTGSQGSHFQYQANYPQGQCNYPHGQANYPQGQGNYPLGQNNFNRSPNPSAHPQQYNQQRTPNNENGFNYFNQKMYPPQPQQGFIPQNIPMSDGIKPKIPSHNQSPIQPQMQPPFSDEYNGNLNNIFTDPTGHNKIHGPNLNKNKGRKQLYNDIRSGNFGI